MKRLSASLTLTAASALALTALAQPPAPPPDRGPQPEQPSVPQPQQQQPQPADISAQEIDTFTTIYVEVRAIAEEYEGRMAAAEDPQEAQELQAQMQEATLGTIQDHGWTQEQYAQTVRAINNDPALLDEAMALIEQKS